MVQVFSTDSDTAARHKANFNTSIVNNVADRPYNIKPDDELAHIEDTPLFWVSVNGRPTLLTWNEMSDEQHDMQRLADRRAADLAMFRMCDWEGVY